MGLQAPFADPRGKTFADISRLTGVKIQTLTTWANDYADRICAKAEEEYGKALYETENGMAFTNVLMSIISLQLTFGHLKTVQKGYDKFIQNLMVAQERIQEKGIWETYKSLVLELGINELEFEDFDINDLWERQKHKEAVLSGLIQVTDK